MGTLGTSAALLPGDKVPGTAADWEELEKGVGLVRAHVTIGCSPGLALALLHMCERTETGCRVDHFYPS